MRVLGCDPGISSAGLAVMDGLKIVDYTIFGTKAGVSLQTRLESIRLQFMAFLHKHKPDAVVIEEFFPSRMSGSSTSKMIGVLMICCEAYGVKCYFYSPQDLKKKVRDNLPPPEKLPRRKKGEPKRQKVSKKITKKQVGDYVNKRLGTSFDLPDSRSHITDALMLIILFLDGVPVIDT